MSDDPELLHPARMTLLRCDGNAAREKRQTLPRASGFQG